MVTKIGLGVLLAVFLMMLSKGVGQGKKPTSRPVSQAPVAKPLRQTPSPLRQLAVLPACMLVVVLFGGVAVVAVVLLRRRVRVLPSPGFVPPPPRLHMPPPLPARPTSQSAGPPAPQERGGLLTRGEQALYDVLLDVAMEGQAVMAKPRLADVVDGLLRDRSWRRRLGEIAKMHVDFVICEKRSLTILAVIELDDRSHDRPERRERDALVDEALAAARIPVHHVRAQQAYDVEALRQLLRSHPPSVAGE